MILEVRAASKNFGGFKAIHDVSLDVTKGSIHAIIGPNGAGKSTLFNLISGHLHATGGKIIFKGEDITKMAPYDICRKGIGRSFQLISIFPNLTVLENIRVAKLSWFRKNMDFFSSSEKMFLNECQEVLDKVGLSGKGSDLAGILAYGQQKQLELGIALSVNPELLLLDEPTAGMSIGETTTQLNLIGRLARDHSLTVLFTEHDMTVVFSIAEKITVLHQGIVLAEGKPEDIRNDEKVKRIYLGKRE
jgi:branched-chain amino acid transport system ATP-binding protein